MPPLNRQTVYFILIIGALLNALARPFGLWAMQMMESGADAQLGVPPLILLCILLGLAAFSDARSRVELKSADRIILLSALLLMALPFAKASWMALVLLSVGAGLLGNHWTQRQRAGLAILAAVGCRDPFATLAFDLLAGPLLRIDAIAAAQITQAISGTVEISGNLVTRDGGHSLLVLSGCATFKNLSYALTAWFCVVRYHFKGTPAFWLTGTLLVTLAISCINLLRLGLMGISRQDYIFIHDGWGSQMFQAAMLCAVALLIAGSLRYANTRT